MQNFFKESSSSALTLFVILDTELLKVVLYVNHCSEFSLIFYKYIYTSRLHSQFFIFEYFYIWRVIDL